MDFIERTHPLYSTPIYGVQYAIDGVPAPYVWALKQQLVELGEEAFFELMKEHSLEALEYERRRVN